MFLEKNLTEKHKDLSEIMAYALKLRRLQPTATERVFSNFFRRGWQTYTKKTTLSVKDREVFEGFMLKDIKRKRKWRRDIKEGTRITQILQIGTKR